MERRETPGWLSPPPCGSAYWVLNSVAKQIRCIRASGNLGMNIGRCCWRQDGLVGWKKEENRATYMEEGSCWSYFTLCFQFFSTAWVKNHGMRQKAWLRIPHYSVPKKQLPLQNHKPTIHICTHIYLRLILKQNNTYIFCSFLSF